MEAAVRSRSPRLTYQEEFDALRQQVSATPESAKVKGMYIDSFLKTLDRQRVARPTTQRFLSFKDYPLRDLMNMLLESITLLHPSLPPKEALRLLGRLVYPTLSQSTVGKILFSIAGRDFKAALGLAGKAYQISLTPCEADLVELTDHSARLRLRECYNFPDSYQVGVIEGAMDRYGVQGTVTPEPLARLGDVDLVIKWR